MVDESSVSEGDTGNADAPVASSVDVVETTETPEAPQDILLSASEITLPSPTSPERVMFTQRAILFFEEFLRHVKSEALELTDDASEDLKKIIALIRGI